MGPHTDGAEVERHNRGPPRNMGNDHSFDRCCCAGFCLRASQHGLWFRGFCSHTEHFMQHKFLLAPCLGRYSDSGLPTRLLHRRACAALCRPHPPPRARARLPPPCCNICQPDLPAAKALPERCLCVCVSVCDACLSLSRLDMHTYLHTYT